MSPHERYIGVAGMVGYKIEAEDTTLYLRLLASCQYGYYHYSIASVRLQDGGIDKQEYDSVEDELNEPRNSQPLDGKTLKVSRSRRIKPSQSVGVVSGSSWYYC